MNVSVQTVISNPLNDPRIRVTFRQSYADYKKVFKQLVFFLYPDTNGIGLGIAGYSTVKNVSNIIEPDYVGVLETETERIDRPIYFMLPKELLQLVTESNFSEIMINDRFLIFHKEVMIPEEHYYIMTGTMRIRG